MVEITTNVFAVFTFLKSGTATYITGLVKRRILLYCDVVCATRGTTQTEYVNSTSPYLDYNDLGATITTCRLFTNSSVDNHQSRRKDVY